MSKGNNVKTVGEIVISILLLLVVMGVIAFIARYTNNFTAEFQTFYVGYNNRVFAEKDDFEVAAGSEIEFKVSYAFDFIDKETEAAEYIVQVVPVIDEKTVFSFMVDGKEYEYNAELDLTSAFKIIKKDGAFSFKIPHSMFELLVKLYPDKSVELIDEADILRAPYFKVEVTSHNSDIHSQITIHVLPAKLKDIELDKVKIIL